MTAGEFPTAIVGGESEHTVWGKQVVHAADDLNALVMRERAQDIPGSEDEVEARGLKLAADPDPRPVESGFLLSCDSASSRAMSAEDTGTSPPAARKTVSTSAHTGDGLAAYFEDVCAAGAIGG